jgi:hypothetical protein
MSLNQQRDGREAVQAGAVILEPIMKMEVTA